MRVPKNSLVVVADGRKLLFFRNEGDALNPSLSVVDKHEQDNPADRDQSSDAPGTSFASVGARRSSMEETDFHQLEEDRFAAAAAEMLRKGALRNDYESLIIVAPAKTLGEMRKHYHAEVAKRLDGELAKDLTGHPVDQIERLLADAA